jgi:hypothetical protein
MGPAMVSMVAGFVMMTMMMGGGLRTAGHQAKGNSCSSQRNCKLGTHV